MPPPASAATVVPGGEQKLMQPLVMQPALLHPAVVASCGQPGEKVSVASAAAPLVAVVRPAAESAPAFWEGYAQLLLHVLTAPDYEAACAALRARLAPNFVSVPLGGPAAAEETVLAQWRMSLQLGHCSGVSLSDCVARRLSDGCEECQLTLVRRYAGRLGQDLQREMLRLQVVARPCEQGLFRVLRHSYLPVAPREVNGVPSQSQICQDLWVLGKFQGRLKEPGFFLEIGANHSQHLSNTYLLEKAASWTGVCVEPFPQGDWQDRRVELVQAAIGPEGGVLRFLAPGHVLGGLVDQVDVARVLAEAPPDQHQVVEVATRSISAILAQARPGGREVPRVIHFLSLDTEGSEFNILSDFPFERHAVLTIAVEHNFKEPARTQIRQLLLARGFHCDMTVEHDDFYLLANYEAYL